MKYFKWSSMRLRVDFRNGRHRIAAARLNAFVEQQDMAGRSDDVG
jgi:hypothetical protein